MDYLPERQQVKFAQDEISMRKFYKYEGTNGKTWLVADQANKADNIYVTNPHNRCGEGFGGAKMTFNLVNGETFTMNVGWQSDSQMFFEDTSIDIRNTYLTRVIIAETRKYQKGFYIPVLENVLYYEDEPMLGYYHRYKKIAEGLLLSNNIDSVVYCVESMGGHEIGYIIKTDIV